jgi:hypothetical protein
MRVAVKPLVEPDVQQAVPADHWSPGRWSGVGARNSE